MSESTDKLPLLHHDSAVNNSEAKSERLTFALVFLVVTIVMSSFNFGYNIGVINTPKQAIICQKDIEPGGSCLGNSWGGLVPACIPLSEFQWSAVVSSSPVGGLIGGLIGGKFADIVGRKKLLIINNLFFLIAAVLSGFAVNFGMLFVGRGVIGFASGIASSVVPMYLSEIAPSRLRGGFATLNQLMLTVGILVSQLMAIGLSSCPTWRYLLAFVSGFLAIIQTILLPMSPESPRWLLMRGKNKEAKEALEILRGGNVSSEFASMNENSESGSSTNKFTELFSHPFLKPLIIGIGLQLAQQLSGINAVFYYSTSIFQKAGVGNADVASAIIGAVNVIATIVATVLMDKAGRRPLLLASQIIQFVFLLSLALSMIFSNSLQTFGSFLLVGSVILFVVGFAIGMGPIPWFIIAEMFPGGLRGYAVSIAVGVNWSANTLVALLFPFIESSLGNYTFLLFTVIVFAFTIFSWFLVVETKGKSIEELTGGGNKGDSV